MNIRELDNTYIAGTYKRFPVEIVKGEGSVVTDVDGKQYIKVSISWNGATERVAAADEKPEDKERLDADFAKKVKESQEKAKELNDRLSPWTYEVGTNALSSIDKTFADFLKDKPKEEPKKDDAKEEK